MNHRGPESSAASSEAIHFHHSRRRGHFRRGGSTKGGLCLGAFVGNGGGISWLLSGMPWKKPEKMGEKYVCFLLVQSLPPKIEGQNRTHLSKWKEYKLVQIVVYPLLPRLSPFHLGIEKIARKLRNMHISPAALLGTVNFEWWNLSIFLAVFRVQKSQSQDGSWGAWVLCFV